MVTAYRNLQHDNTEILRYFANDVADEELKWHRDRETRCLQLTHETDWQIQLDNELPKPLQTGLIIPMGCWHRLIKGTGDLTVRILLQ